MAAVKEVGDLTSVMRIFLCARASGAGIKCSRRRFADNSLKLILKSDSTSNDFRMGESRIKRSTWTVPSRALSEETSANRSAIY